MQGQVIKSTGSWYSVKLSNCQIINCRIRGKFRLDNIKTSNPVVVGDLVTVEKEMNKTDGVITEILPRKNYIIRQSPKKVSFKNIVAANLDQAFLIVTFKQPRTSLGFINRFLIVAEAYHIPTFLIFNKTDIYSENDLQQLNETKTLYQNAGYTSYQVSALRGTNMKEMEGVMKDKLTLISGHSGVGKSTFINYVHPNLNLKTNEISKITGKGKHATTYIEMIDLPFGGAIIDTPGIKEFGIVDIQPEDVSPLFPEMRKLLLKCKFKDCLHINEPGCAIKEKVESESINLSRYKSYLSIIDELKSMKKWELE